MSSELEYPSQAPQSGELAVATHQSQLPALRNHNGDAQSTAPAFDVYAEVHRALRGRYPLACMLAACGALVGAIIGFIATTPQYKSEGLVRLAYALPTVLRETDQNKPLAMFESFVRSQQSRMTSRAVVEQALKSPTWQATRRGAGPDIVADFADHLTVEHPPGTEHLRVSYIDPDPGAAAAAVQAIISTFELAYNDQEDHLQKQRLSMLEERRKELSDRLNTVGTRADQLAVMDSLLSEYLKRQVMLENELKQLEIQGYLNNHRRVTELRTMLDRTSGMIQEYSEAARKLHDMDSRHPAAPGASTNPYRNEGGVAANGNDVYRGDDRSRRDLLSVEGSLMQMQRLQGDSENIRKELSETTQRMEALKVEAGLASRLEIISAGDTPLMPHKDRRRLFAGAGAIGGAAIPVAILALLGILKPVYRRSEDLTDDLGEALPMLGSVPSLTNRLSDLVLSANAAQSIHQIRVRLQMLRDREDRRTFLISSAVAHEGKTSLTTSLGLSFAASGSRVLLIDLDLVGRRLTRGFRCENREGAFEALTRLDPRGCLRETAHGLWVMPAGNVDPQHACTISSTAVRSILAHMRDTFDVVLIDTGPVLGSVETSLAAPAVDGVVLTVARGQQPWRVAKAVDHLETLGARVAGVVFNRADPGEFVASSYRTSLSSTPFDRDRMGPTAVRENGLKADLVVQSVMTFLPAGLIAPDAPPSTAQAALQSAPAPVETAESEEHEPLHA